MRCRTRSGRFTGQSSPLFNFNQADVCLEKLLFRHVLTLLSHFSLWLLWSIFIYLRHQKQDIRSFSGQSVGVHFLKWEWEKSLTMWPHCADQIRSRMWSSWSDHSVFIYTCIDMCFPFPHRISRYRSHCNYRCKWGLSVITTQNVSHPGPGINTISYSRTPPQPRPLCMFGLYTNWWVYLSANTHSNSPGPVFIKLLWMTLQSARKY